MKTHDENMAQFGSPIQMDGTAFDHDNESGELWDMPFWVEIALWNVVAFSLAALIIYSAYTYYVGAMG